MKKGLLIVLYVFIIGFLSILNAQLPDDFPAITTVETGETGEGYVFLAVAADVSGVGYYLILLNNDGTVENFKKLEDDYAYDFKVQPNGQLSYAQFLSHHSYTGGGNCIHMIMDQDMNVVDSIQLKNGYIAEAHDFQILPNGHYLAFGYYLTKVDMSQYVDGGHVAAYVSGGIVQEFDADKNVVWQWRSWDHSDIADYSWGRRSGGETVSAWHLNTIGLDADNQLILASPSSTMKVNRTTGDIMYFLGGDDNDFSFVGVDSTEGVSDLTGHAFYLMENGNYLVYDNGGRGGGTSEAHEFSIDMENKVATHVKTFTPAEEVGGWHRGNAYRLPNGNTIVGWGGASGDPIPTATEFDSAGNIVWEASFDNPDVESYRAFRFPLNADTPSAEWTEYEVYPEEWEFNYDTIITGITINIDAYTGDGYNALTVSRYNYAPMKPRFPGRAPMVLAKRVVLDADNITTINGDIIFDVDGFNIRNPEDVTIYHREFEGQGLFIPLTTEYNGVTGVVSAEFNKLGEFIIGWDDVEVVVGTADLIWPEMDENVNQENPVHVEWAPVGFFTDFSLQIATDEEFTTLVVDENLEHTTVYEFSDADDATTYFWRVKTMYEAEEGEWSDTAHFTTSAPSITVTLPNGGEEWQRGLEHWIKWDDNIPEDVLIEVHKADEMVSLLYNDESRGAYEWAIPADLSKGDDYSIVIKSAEDGSVIDASDAYFSIIDTTENSIDTKTVLDRSLAIFPNPTDNQVTIQYQLTENQDVTLSVFDIAGRLLNTVNEGNQSAGNHQARLDLGYYEGSLFIVRLEAGDEMVYRKVSLLR